MLPSPANWRLAVALDEAEGPPPFDQFFDCLLRFECGLWYHGVSNLYGRAAHCLDPGACGVCQGHFFCPSPIVETQNTGDATRPRMDESAAGVSGQR